MSLLGSTTLRPAVDTTRLRRYSPLTRNMVGATVMSSPPTVTLGAAAGATTLPGSATVGPSDPRIRVEGAAGQLKPSATQYMQALQSILSNVAQPPTSGGLQSIRYAFDFDGQKFEIPVFTQANGQVYRIWVDEQPATADLVTLGATDGTARYLLVDFGTRALRRIVIETEGGFLFGGIRVLPTDTVMPPKNPSPVRFAVVGDSMAQGTGASRNGLAYVPTLGRLLGWPDTCSLGVGGTGLLNAGTNNSYAYPGRLSDLQALGQVDVIMVQGTVNDEQAQYVGQMQSALVSYLATLRGLYPAAKLITTSSMQVAQDTGATPTSINAERKAAAAAAGVDYIDMFAPIEGRWFSGTGNAGAPNGTGNNDYYRSSDLVHPSQAGHDYVARRLAAKLAQLAGLPI